MLCVSAEVFIYFGLCICDRSKLEGGDWYCHACEGVLHKCSSAWEHRTAGFASNGYALDHENESDTQVMEVFFSFKFDKLSVMYVLLQCALNIVLYKRLGWFSEDAMIYMCLGLQIDSGLVDMIILDLLIIILS